MSIFFEVRGLVKKFGKLVAVDDIDLSSEEGEIRGLIGPNGSGKTTIFNLISGFLRPTKGKIIWRGKDITGLPPHKIVKEGIVRTFQLPTLLDDMTVLQNIKIGCYRLTRMSLFEQLWCTTKRCVRTYEGEKEGVVEEKSVDILKFIGMEGVKDELAGVLPHGLRKLLQLGIALACEPKLILLDEPIEGMNPIEIEELMNKVKMLRDERGITVIIVEHNVKVIMGSCEKITVINFGKKIAEGTPKEVIKNKEVIKAYIGR